MRRVVAWLLLSSSVAFPASGVECIKPKYARDTLTVLDVSNQQHKIRLAGIDAPEKKQPFGDRSKQHLAEMVFNKAVAVEWSKRDRYGRNAPSSTLGLAEGA